MVQLRKIRIIHRDIKPANILLNKYANIKLCDFEFSKLMEESMASTFVGTIYYWPPERFNYNIEKYDDRSEVWSMGITLAEIAYGKIPLGENYKKHDLFLLQKEIAVVDKMELIKKCFDGYPDKMTDLIHKCLSPYDDRPKISELLTSEFYQTYYCASMMDKFCAEYYLKVFIFAFFVGTLLFFSYLKEKNKTFRT